MITCKHKKRYLINICINSQNKEVYLRRYLNKSNNPYSVSELDIERLGDPVSEPHAEEAEEEWFVVPEEAPLLPDWLTPIQAPQIQSPVTTAPTGLNMFRHHSYVPNHLPLPLQGISIGWFIQNQISSEIPVYRPKPKAAGQAQLFQPVKTQKHCRSQVQQVSSDTWNAHPG
ncbi:hypothetical protein DPMN_110118 [Dreissena polymorpha]|uniref:Uncharacterized protein n=1 Tax=Dreissena polymorpha TaxID=45954 RepID=A0A9D4QMQ7_DREPO|nr:hypothetical protein DPMN_110118 [Dreissena polymorpha]